MGVIQILFVMIKLCTGMTLVELVGDFTCDHPPSLTAVDPAFFLCIVHAVKPVHAMLMIAVSAAHFFWYISSPVYS
jgi:hypothetical protein